MVGCPHSAGKSGTLENSYRLGVKLALALYTQKLDSELACSVCNAPNAICCLECDYVGCAVHGKHGSNHDLGVCLWRSSEGYLFCFECNTMVFDPDFERLRIEEVHSALGSQDAGLVLATSEIRPDTTKALKTAVRPSFHAMTGLRGFYNMGATCYMSVILQSLVHNPLVRGFFLAGGHDSKACGRQDCVQCCVDRVYCDIFSSDAVSGYGIPDLLQATAINMPALTGATEQDAHEFLHFLLEQFHHSHYPEKAFSRANLHVHDQVAEPTQDPENCSCVAHRTFAGMLESTLECECGFIKHTYDPLMDLSLELTGGTVQECLTRFTSPEKLSHYKCSNCEQVGLVSKRILIRKLPPVVQIQLKRFKHTGSTSTKLEKKVGFDQYLDLSPYVTHKEGDRAYIYELYGVVLHSGSLDTGHYTCMMKHASGQWFHFDDSVVRAVDAHTVLNTTAYLLFYTVKYAV